MLLKDCGGLTLRFHRDFIGEAGATPIMCFGEIFPRSWPTSCRYVRFSVAEFLSTPASLDHIPEGPREHQHRALARLADLWTEPDDARRWSTSRRSKVRISPRRQPTGSQNQACHERAPTGIRRPFGIRHAPGSPGTVGSRAAAENRAAGRAPGSAPLTRLALAQSRMVYAVISTARMPPKNVRRWVTRARDHFSRGEGTPLSVRSAM